MDQSYSTLFSPCESDKEKIKSIFFILVIFQFDNDKN